MVGPIKILKREQRVLKFLFTFGLMKFVVSATINLQISDSRAHGGCAPAEMMLC